MIANVEPNDLPVQTDHLHLARVPLFPRLLTLAPLALATYVVVPAFRVERWAGDAGLYAALSAKVWRDGHWWTLQGSFEPYFNKPPLAFWLHALSIGAFGEGPLGLYLPDVLSYLATILLTQFIAWRLALGAALDPRDPLERARALVVGSIIGLLLASLGQFMAMVDALKLDYPHNAFMFGGVAMMVHATAAPSLTDRARRRWTLLAGLPVGLALLVKPMWALAAYLPVILWLAIVAATGALAEGRRFVRVLMPRVALSALIAVLVALPWHASMMVMHRTPTLAQPGFTEQYFLKQSFSRVTTDRFATQPWNYYFQYVWDTCRPLIWLMLAGVAAWVVVEVPRRLARRWPGALTLNPAVNSAVHPSIDHSPARLPHPSREGSPARFKGGALLLALVWVIFWTVVLTSVPDKRRNFFLHVYPGLAILAACCMLWPLAALRLRSAARTAVVLIALAGVGLVLANSRPSPLTRFNVGPNDPMIRYERFWAPVIDYLKNVREPVYVGSVGYPDAGMLYVKSGVWARGVKWSNLPMGDLVPEGALVIYDDRRRGPPGGAEVVFRTQHPKGNIWVVRQGPRASEPAPAPVGAPVAEPAGEPVAQPVP